MTRSKLAWASSKMIGRVSEIAVLTPVRKGVVPGERRTYEERLATAIDSLAARVKQGLPNQLNLVQSIHFGRIMLIRPEQYLLYSDITDVQYRTGGDPALRVPAPMDEYRRGDSSQRADGPELRTFMLTTVEFDGDLKVYFRDVAVFFSQAFDQLFENCEDFPGTANFEQFWLWIRRYQINTPLFYSAYPQLSVVRIKQLELFKRRFDAFVAKVRSPTGPRVRSMDEMFDEFLRENQQIAFGFPAPGGTFEPNGEEEGSL
jgi:hypothetical protein